ncbi:hypothetical protein B0F90DRAFT_1738078, partial [Multifurca ochricompacta]
MCGLLISNPSFLSHLDLTVTHDGEDVAMDSTDDSREYPCLIRVTDGGDTQFSTHITSGKLDKFLGAYGTLLKSSMNTLRKRDKKREKLRTDKLAARKQRLAEPIPIEGPKRGNGRKKHRRQHASAYRKSRKRRKRP